MKQLFDRDKAESLLDTSIRKAEEYVQDEDKLEKLLQQLEVKLKNFPVAGGMLSYIPVMISLVRAFVRKEYRSVPLASMVAIVATMVYWLIPVDLIPDFLPVVGYLDDAAIVAGAMSMVKTDLDEYMRWRKEKGLWADDLPECTREDKEVVEKFARLRNLFRKKLLGSKKKRS